MRAELLGLAIFSTALVATGLALAQPAVLPEPCEVVVFEDDSFVICTASSARHDIRLFLLAPDRQPYGSLEAFATEGPRVVFAMNAGMYLPNRTPQGLYVEEGRTMSPLVTGGGAGNFHLKPNGVFFVTENGRAEVVETEAFVATAEVVYATQSGPMLVIDDALHPAFAENGDSRFVRNGVGVRANGDVVFAISLTEVSFGRFARLFRDALGCLNALYLDGFVSALSDDNHVLVGGDHAAGPIVAVLDR